VKIVIIVSQMLHVWNIYLYTFGQFLGYM
jgi:hypothetical protein